MEWTPIETIIAFWEWFSEAFQRRLGTNVRFEATRYFTATLGVLVVVWGVFEGALKTRKIRPPTPRKKQIRREILYSMTTVFVFMVMNIFLFEGAAGGVFKFYDDVGQFGWGYVWLSFGLLVVFHDAYFYWTHRAMHHPTLFRWFHSTHHRSKNPTPFTAYAFDIPEAIVNYMVVPIFALIMPLHDQATVFFLWFMIFRNAIAHCGYELMPHGWARHPVLGLSSAVTHHDMHHEKMTGNYGFYFTFWDRVMGTEHGDYLDRVDRATQSQRQPQLTGAAGTEHSVGS